MIESQNCIVIRKNWFLHVVSLLLLFVVFVLFYILFMVVLNWFSDFFFFPCSEREVPTSNIDLHYAHCSRNLQKCTICGEMVPKKHADMHYTETHAPVWSNDSHSIYYARTLSIYTRIFPTISSNSLRMWLHPWNLFSNIIPFRMLWCYHVTSCLITYLEASHSSQRQICMGDKHAGLLLENITWDIGGCFCYIFHPY